MEKRIGKYGISSFVHDVDTIDDKKVKILKAKFDLIGYAVYMRLLEELYRINGYFLRLEEDFHILFVDENNLDYELYMSILKTCLEKDLFNKELFAEHKILTSKRIQKNYLNETKREKEIVFIEEYLLIEKEKIINNYNYDYTQIYYTSLDTNKKQPIEETVKKKKRNKKRNKKFNPRKDSYTELYQKVYDMYPLKQGKRPGMINFYKRLENYSEEQLINCIKRYKKHLSISKTDKRYYFKISNFFGTKAYFEDFLDSEIENNDIESEEKQNNKNPNNSNNKEESEIDRLYKNMEKEGKLNGKEIASEY